MIAVPVMVAAPVGHVAVGRFVLLVRGVGDFRLVVLAELLHLRLAIVQHFAACQRTVLVGVDGREELVLEGGHLVLGNLAVLVGIGVFQKADEHHVLHHGAAGSIMAAGATTPWGCKGGNGGPRDQHCSKGRQNDLPCGHWGGPSGCFDSLKIEPAAVKTT